MARASSSSCSRRSFRSASAFSRSFPAKREVTASRADVMIFSSDASSAATNEGEPVSDPEGDREADSDTETEAAALTDSSEGDAGGDSDTADETGKDVVSGTGAVWVGFTAISGLFCWDSILSPFLRCETARGARR